MRPQTMPEIINRCRELSRQIKVAMFLGDPFTDQIEELDATLAMLVELFDKLQQGRLLGEVPDEQEEPQETK